MTMPLKDRLIFAREASGFPKAKPAAERAGITPSALYQLESGATKSLSGDTAHKLGAVYTGFRIEWLISGTGPRRHDGAGAVGEDRQAYGSSHSLRIDPETIAAALKLIRLTYQNLQNQGLDTAEPDNEEDATELAYAYEYLYRNGQRVVTPENVIDFSKILAKRLRANDDDERDETRTGNARSTG